MASGDGYRVKATELFAKAGGETSPALPSELEGMALAYLRLAAQAERNSRADPVYDPPPRHHSDDRER